MPTSEGEPQKSLGQAARGDQDAWERLVTMYSPRVFALLVRQCGDRELAEEVTQATFVKVVTAIGKYKELGHFEPWLFRIAMNHLRDDIRRRRRQAVPASGGSGEEGTPGGLLETGAPPNRSADQTSPDPYRQASRREQIEKLQEAIAGMSEADQKILTLRHTAGLSFAQIAETLGEPLGTVLARSHRAVAKLRTIMGGETSASRRPRKGKP